MKYKKYLKIIEIRGQFSLLDGNDTPILMGSLDSIAQKLVDYYPSVTEDISYSVAAGKTPVLIDLSHLGSKQKSLTTIVVNLLLSKTIDE